MGHPAAHRLAVQLGVNGLPRHHLALRPGAGRGAGDRGVADVLAGHALQRVELGRALAAGGKKKGGE